MYVFSRIKKKQVINFEFSVLSFSNIFHFVVFNLSLHLEMA